MRRTPWVVGSVLVCMLASVGAVWAGGGGGGSCPTDCCATPSDCCVGGGNCVITDKQTLGGLTVDATISCQYNLGTLCGGGDGSDGRVPRFGDCGLSFCDCGDGSCSSGCPSRNDIFNNLDHYYLHGSDLPIVASFPSPVNTVYVFPAVDHFPFPEEGIEHTVWGSNSCEIDSFPTGWTRATLTKIYKKGWADPAACQGQDNSDDFTGQYSFPGSGFTHIAVYANFSITIFNTPSHTSWTTDGDDSSTSGWQSFDEEIDAVGTPVCAPDAVVANAGNDQTGLVGGQVCFDGSGSTPAPPAGTYGWDLNGDSVIDASGTTACKSCESESEGDVTLYVTDTCGCVDSDTAHYRCLFCPANPAPLTQGYWHRQCLGTGEIRPGRNGRGPTSPIEPDFVSQREPCTDGRLEALGFYGLTTCEGLDAVPASDPCERAKKQMTALILNVCSGRLGNGCPVNVSGQGCTSTNVTDLLDEIAGLIQSGACQRAASCAGAVNEGTGSGSEPEVRRGIRSGRKFFDR